MSELEEAREEIARLTKRVDELLDANKREIESRRELEQLINGAVHSNRRIIEAMTDAVIASIRETIAKKRFS